MEVVIAIVDIMHDQPQVGQDNQRSAIFLSHAKDLIAMYKPFMGIFIEPRVSGVKADKVIAKLGFDFSRKVDARGFAGGI
ncbi:hypothetical protein REPUB_Repub14bG0011700 [Reevesia pubescens]